MAKKVLLLVKANPSPFAKEVLEYHEKIIRKSIDVSSVTLCNTYQFICKELNFGLFLEDRLIPRIRSGSIGQIIVFSKTIISSNPSFCDDYENFCNFYDISLMEISSISKLLYEVIGIRE